MRDSDCYHPEIVHERTVNYKITKGFFHKGGLTVLYFHCYTCGGTITMTPETENDWFTQREIKRISRING